MKDVTRKHIYYTYGGTRLYNFTHLYVLQHNNERKITFNTNKYVD